MTLPKLQKSNLGMTEMKTPDDVNDFWNNLLEEPGEEDIEKSNPGTENPIWQNILAGRDIPIWLRKFSDSSYIEFIIV